MQYNLEEMLSAVAHRNRLALIKQILSAGSSGLIVGAAAETSPVKQGTVSYHLNKMLNAGLLEVKPDGRYRIYKVSPDGFKFLMEFLKNIIVESECYKEN